LDEERMTKPMPLVTTKEMFKKAYEGGYAIGAFNVNNMEIVQGIADAAIELKSPVILQVSAGARKYAKHNYLVKLVEAVLAEAPDLPIALHLDHGADFEICKSCIDGGFTSVMIDASTKELNENITITKAVVEYAHSKNVTVEAEIGHIGVSEDNSTESSLNATLEDCEILYKNTNVDSLAPALGSVHGLYKGEPNLDFETMQLINNKLPIPLVLHGGTGIPEDKKSIAITVELGDMSKTLTDEEIGAVIDNITENLANKFGASLRK